METYRLKNIILVILLLLNAFLLLLVASRGYTQHRSAQNLIDQTVLLLQNSDVSIDPELLQGQDTAFTFSYERNMEEELTFTTALLGALVDQQDAGGGTQQYTFTGGSAVFRSNGAFQLTIASPALQVEKPEVFVKKYCPAQYALTAVETEGSVSYTHLDVYKRQGYHAQERGLRNGAGIERTGAGISPGQKDPRQDRQLFRRPDRLGA